MKHFDETRRAFTPYGFTCEIWEAAPMSRPDRHDEIEINFLDQGTLSYLLGGRRVTFQPQTMTMFWAAIPHQIVGFDNLRLYYVATIPFELFLQWPIPKEMLHRLMMGEVLAEQRGQRTGADALMFEQWNRDLAAPTEEMCKIVELEMAARTLRLATSTASGLAPDLGPHDPAMPHLSDGAMQEPAHLGKAETMACFVARNYRTRIQIQQIAETVDLHPDYASTLFRQTFGTTLTALITKHRVADAQRQLLTTDDPIVKIAQTAGFNSLSRFNLAFKQIAGMTPREYRKQRPWVLPGEPSTPHDNGPTRSLARQQRRRQRRPNES